jgi:hypothetical protein
MKTLVHTAGARSISPSQQYLFRSVCAGCVRPNTGQNIQTKHQARLMAEVEEVLQLIAREKDLNAKILAQRASGKSGSGGATST